MNLTARMTTSLLALILLGVFSLSPSIAQPDGAQPDSGTIDALIDRHMRDSAFPGIAAAVLKDGRALYREAKGVDGYGEQLTEQSPMFIGFLSKSLTALAVMQLVEDGVVSLDAPVREYIPYFSVADPEISSSITVRNLLQQQSGLSRKNSLPASDNDTSLEERVKALAEMPAAAKPGETFQYLNDNYNILGLLIEEVTGTSYGAHMEETVFGPLGMHDTTAKVSAIREQEIKGHSQIFGINAPRRQSVPRYDVPSGYIVSNLRDMRAYLEFLIDPNEEVLTQESIALMREAGTGSDYGMGRHISDAAQHTVFEHSGAVPAFSAHLAVAPGAESGYVYLTNKNHLFNNFVGSYETLNGNLNKAMLGQTNFQHFPSIWAMRIVSLLILALALRDVWKTLRLIPAEKPKRAWRKALIQSLLLFVFLSIGLPAILEAVLGMRVELSRMLAYVPDFTVLLIVAVTVQAARVIISSFRLLRG